MCSHTERKEKFINLNRKVGTSAYHLKLWVRLILGIMFRSYHTLEGSDISLQQLKSEAMLWPKEKRSWCEVPNGPRSYVSALPHRCFSSIGKTCFIYSQTTMRSLMHVHKELTLHSAWIGPGSNRWTHA